MPVLGNHLIIIKASTMHPSERPNCFYARSPLLLLLISPSYSFVAEQIFGCFCYKTYKIKCLNPVIDPLFVENVLCHAIIAVDRFAQDGLLLGQPFVHQPQL